MAYLPAALSSDTPRAYGGAMGAYQRDPERRSVWFQLESLSKAGWEKLRNLARVLKNR